MREALLVTLLALLHCSSGSPLPLGFSSSIPLLRARGTTSRSSSNETLAWAGRELQRVKGRYGEREGALAEKEKRAVGSVSLINAYGDSFYYGTISVGSPPKDFQVIIDTGSADLWLATAPCSGCTSETPLYDPDSSSTAGRSGSSFDIIYGSGDASGTLARDVVSIAGLENEGQVFAAATTSTNILSGNVSGVLGAAWQSIANTRAKPLLQSLAEEGLLDENVFGLALTRVGNPVASESTMERGGLITIGGLDTSLYEGTINWTPLADNGSYWLIPLQGIYLNGQDLAISAPAIAIDSGTSLIGGPSDVIAAIYAAIPQSQSIVVNGQQGYYAILCNSQVDMSFILGGVAYHISQEDFNAGNVDERGRYCLGALFALDTASSAPDWIVGAAFLKNVYAAFRFSPEPAVGLALLSEGADKLGEGGLAGEKAEGKSTSAGRRASERGMKGWLGAGCVLCAIAVL